MGSVKHLHTVRILLIPLLAAIVCIALMRVEFALPEESQTVKSATFQTCANSSASSVPLPDNWRSDTRTKLECGVYEFNIQRRETQKAIGILVPSYRFNIRLSINEIEVASSKGRRNQVLPFYTEVPAAMLHSGLNRVSIKLLSDPIGEGFLDKIVIGKTSQLTVLENKLVLVRHTIPQIIAIIVLIFSGISIFLYFIEREAKEFLYFSLLSIAWTIHIFNLIWSDPIFSTYVWMKIVMCAVLTFATFGCLFVGAFLKVEFPRIDKTIKIAAVAWYLLLIFLPIKASMVIGLNIFMSYILLLAFITAYKFFAKFNSSSIFDAASVYLALNTAIIITGINDIALMMNLIDDSIVFYLNHSAAALILGIWLQMFSKYFQLMKLKTNFSNVLEAELSTQKKELQASLKRERAAIEKNAALNERESVMRDLHDSMGARLMSLVRLSNNSKKTRSLAQETLDELRFMTTPLRISDRDIVTLLATFREQRLNRLEQSGFKVTWSIEDIPDIPEWNTQQAMEFLRILDELLGNALKHGKDNGITVDLRKAPTLELRFMNTTNSNKINKEDGAGLNNIHIRSQQVGAEFSHTLEQRRFTAKIVWQDF